MNIGDNEDGLKKGDPQVLGQESTSTTNAATSCNATCSHSDKEKRELLETTAPAEEMVVSSDRASGKTNKATAQDTEEADSSGGGELQDMSDYKKRQGEM
eukprot:8961149-Ditylum_brightwellii.AAC.1